MNLKNLNERHRKVYDTAGAAGNLVAELPTERYTVETNDGMHRIYDAQPTQGESNPLADMQHPLSEQETKDRAAVNDAALSMPARLAALNRLSTKR
jgi:hypothetical protein